MNETFIECMGSRFVGKLVGDVMLAAAFVSYAGPFNAKFRQDLVLQQWLPDLQERAIPLTQGIMPLDILANDTEKVLIATSKTMWES